MPASPSPSYYKEFVTPPKFPTPANAPRLLRLGAHFLMVTLLSVVVLRAIFPDSSPAPWPAKIAITATAVTLGAVYAAAAVLPVIRRSQIAARLWLALLAAIWLALLALTPDGTWVAFVLFFLELHVLPRLAGLVAVAVTTAVTITGFALHQGSFAPAAAIGPVMGAAVAIGVVLGYQALSRESEHRRELIETLLATQAELANAERAAGAVVERDRLAREIHDTLAQGFSSILLLLGAAGRSLPGDPDQAARHLELARQCAQDNLNEARNLVRALAPPDLRNGSLSTALSRLCGRATAQSGLAAGFQISGTPVPLATALEVAMLRIAQSAVANAILHARASRVELTLSYMEDGVTLDVVDDGAGFDPAALVSSETGSGFGLAAMRSRVAVLGGSVSVESEPGRGTAVVASFARRDDPETVGPETVSPADDRERMIENR
jgi:signal transduction histidine kinase